MEDLKTRLDALVQQYNVPQFVGNDPVQFPRMFTAFRDIEIAAFLSSTIAWGNRKQILQGCHKMLFNIMHGKPFEYVMNGECESINPDINIHRTFFGRDLQYMCRGLKWVYTMHETMEDVFARELDPWNGISYFNALMADGNDGKSNKHLSDPGRKTKSHKGASACKRMHLMLRWLVRKDGNVDLGVWRRIPENRLMIPLDVHVGRVARELGLLERKQDDRMAVELLTDKLREYDINDPIRYDFALFGYGEQQKHQRA